MHFAIFALAAGVLPIRAHITVELRDMAFHPPNVTAVAGDFIVFRIHNGNHSVTQSTFESPCTPSPANISSGFIHANSHKRFWTYKVSHKAARAPVWFYCQQTNPKNFCHAGMVFAINPRLSYPAFLQAAMTSSSNSSAIALSNSTASSTLTSNSVSPTASESTGTESRSTTKKDIRLKIGILVGGICLSVITCLVAFLVYWRWRSKSRGESERDWMITRPFISHSQQDSTSVDALHNRREAAVVRAKNAARKSGVEEGSISSDANAVSVD
ncbi:hypothetical protein BDQ17DRAFT_367840 [Cyathus striatus]|nr:hypothetical protein BDQ17DRAFT_367840 [Cyathus striatus]